MGKIQFPNLRALPAGPRWLAYGVLLLCAILVGGVITAYGGMLLVVLMWAVCMGGLCLLLHFTWQTVFPGQRVAQDKTFLRSWLAGSAVGVAVITALVCYRQTVYSDDAINYFAKQTLLFGSFGQSGFYGIHVLLESLLTADYKMFMNLFISVPYLFTGRSINAFMVCYAITCFVPMWFALLMGAKYLAQQLPACHTALYYPLCMAVMVLWPMFLWPATHGMPDAFGLTFAAVIALLCADYRFETLPWPRLLAIFAATFALILTRRWYMFWILAFYAVYVLAVLVGAVRRKTLGSTLKHMLLFGVPSAVIIVGGAAAHLQNHPDNRLRRYLRRLLRRRLWQQLPGPAAHPGTDLAGALRGRLGVAAVLPQHPCTGYCSRRGQLGGDGAVYPYPVPGRPPEPDPCAFLPVDAVWPVRQTDPAKGKALAAQCCGGCSGRIFGGQLRQRPASAR